MSQRAADPPVGGGATAGRRPSGGGRSDPGTGVTGLLRRGMESGAVPLAAASLSLLSAIRARRRGATGRAIARLLLSVLFTAMVVSLRGPDAGNPAKARGGRSSPAVDPTAYESGFEKRAERTDVATGGSPGTADTDGGRPTPSGAVATGAGEEAETAAGVAEVREERYERVASAAIDGGSLRVPAPQETINRGVLIQGSEAYWGIREADDAVVVSGRYDPIREAAGMRYVASSEVGTDSRLLGVPDAVLDHWDAVAGGGTAVAGGPELTFLTSAALADRDQVRVEPAAWVDDLVDEGG